MAFRVRSLRVALGLAAAAFQPSGAAEPAAARMLELSNAWVRAGVDLNAGGALTFLSRGGGENLINNFDLGRQAQLSFFSGPAPFCAGGQRPAKHWEHLGWNPIQAGDDFGHGSPVLDGRGDGRLLYVKCRPLQWPLDRVEGECTFESWLELTGVVVRATARLNNARADTAQYPARLQELPALYANAPFCRVVSYTGARPFSGGAVSEIPRPAGPHPWAFWVGTEGWAALLDAEGFGVGLITPGRVHFTGGFAGRPGPNDTRSRSCGYLAGQGEEVLDHNIAYTFGYELVAGTLDEIRGRAAAVARQAPPAWTFAADRQGWHYVNACDTGWPVRGMLDVRLERPDPQLVSPLTFWRAEDAPRVVIEAACRTAHASAAVYWQRHGEDAPAGDDTVSFAVVPDGAFHRYTVDLARAASYTGGMVRLRLDPAPAGAPGDWVKIKAVQLGR